MQKKTIIIIGALVVVAAASAMWWWNSDYERRWGCFDNPEGFCFNCSSFVRNFMEMHTDKHDGWYPRGGKTPLDSIARSPEFNDARLAVNFGCHIWNPSCEWEETGTFTEKFCAYRYNEGLRVDDPKHLIVLYWHKPTVWFAHDRKGNTLGRHVLLVNDFSWQFISEDDFQRRQTQTEDYLRKKHHMTKDSALSTEGAPSVEK